jgi:hypothetical protein
MLQVVIIGSAMAVPDCISMKNRNNVLIHPVDRLQVDRGSDKSGKESYLSHYRIAVNRIYQLGQLCFSVSHVTIIKRRAPAGKGKGGSGIGYRASGGET